MSSDIIKVTAYFKNKADKEKTLSKLQENYEHNDPPVRESEDSFEIILYSEKVYPDISSEVADMFPRKNVREGYIDVYELRETEMVHES